ncbi:leucine-rich repeat protein kinase family protein [Striga asiatica]|uniref:Leucine-rich repeat protein kinase family protein n=1 Tax=Striga asiatica TaxID=4170 RepID=A0A5A7QC45_STRAF|nr:leucine-rich repeat protein kinase family protein [Striga asiatica]
MRKTIRAVKLTYSILRRIIVKIARDERKKKIKTKTMRDALYALRTSLNASANQLQDWNPNQVTPCTWSKITCGANNSVISVVLPYLGFSGTMSPRIGELKALTTLDLRGNGITGEIPKEIGNLTSLSMLNLENNQLIGEIPFSIGNLGKLTFLVLSQNNLSGSIPESLASLPSLTDLQIASNNLSGKVPRQLFEVSKYNLSGNHLDCGTTPFPSCESIHAGRKRKPKASMIVGITVSLVVILILGSYLVFIWWKGGKRGLRGDVCVDVSEVETDFLHNDKAKAKRPENRYKVGYKYGKYAPLTIPHREASTLCIIMLIIQTETCLDANKDPPSFEAGSSIIKVRATMEQIKFLDHVPQLTGREPHSAIFVLITIVFSLKAKALTKTTSTRTKAVLQLNLLTTLLPPLRRQRQILPLPFHHELLVILLVPLFQTVNLPLKILYLSTQHADPVILPCLQNAPRQLSSFSLQEQRLGCQPLVLFLQHCHSIPQGRIIIQ